MLYGALRALSRRTSRNVRRVVLLTAIVLALIVAAGASRWGISDTRGDCPRGRALVADALSLDFPNPELDRFLVETLKKAGYIVDYVNGTGVDLELYRRLTDYDVVILRVHGGKGEVRLPDGRVAVVNGLFTGLPWDDRYQELMWKWLAAKATPYHDPSRAYLAVLPGFFTREMRGRFCPGSVVVVGSCFSLYTYEIPVALAQLGLGVYIGWTGPVTVQEIDVGLRMLVDLVYNQGLNWTEAAIEVGKRLGTNEYNSTLYAVILSRQS
ncbi:hypothetical protein Pyrde_0231 [Pyrodictium delaneyi]|uniref:Uncharacterized protein n=1 Tax=Pyrodictium delaneyi TaxID=1273541 RepID=A0A0N7JCT4_9CREN|nr:hypothetical protein Pyrde_0231 [Pyrodictium delaneyi]